MWRIISSSSGRWVPNTVLCLFEIHWANKFPSSIFGTQIFITVFVITRHLALSRASWTRPTLSLSISFTCILILSSRLSLGLQNYLIPYRLSHQIHVYPFSPACLKSSPCYPWFDLVLLLLYVFVFRPLYQICIKMWTGFVMSFTYKTYGFGIEVGHLLKILNADGEVNWMVQLEG